MRVTAPLPETIVEPLSCGLAVEAEIELDELDRSPFAGLPARGVAEVSSRGDEAGSHLAVLDDLPRAVPVLS
jgi:hypothetical protein